MNTTVKGTTTRKTAPTVRNAFSCELLRGETVEAVEQLFCFVCYGDMGDGTEFDEHNKDGSESLVMRHHSRSNRPSYATTCASVGCRCYWTGCSISAQSRYRHVALSRHRREFATQTSDMQRSTRDELTWSRAAMNTIVK